VGKFAAPRNISIGVSIESGVFYYWRPTGPPTTIATLASSSYKNKWVHFAISRHNSTTKIFMNGVSIATLADTTDYNGTADLVIANESTPSTVSAFGGYITYFTWVKGVALYTSDFTVSNNYPTLTNDYVLLLKASSFEGTLGSSVLNNNVSTTPNVPPNFGNTNNQQMANIQAIKSIFSDNSRVYYKPGTLSSCGVGSVRNSSVKSRRI
jgi:hypothetical protein